MTEREMTEAEERKSLWTKGRHCPVEFLKTAYVENNGSHVCYGAGERAAFTPDEAASLVAQGTARYAEVAS